MAKHLIVTADDMGYNVERNQGIIDCFQKKAVTNSSLLVNGVATVDAAALSLKHCLPTGLHFNITEGIPVEKNQYKTLVNETGSFLGKRAFYKAASQKKISPLEVRVELIAQIGRYVQLFGSKPVYVDGHQHAHILPGLAEIFAVTLAEEGVRATRLPLELNLEKATWVGEPLNKFLFIVRDNAASAKPIFKAHNIWFSDSFYGLMTMGSSMTAERLQTGIKRAFFSASKSAGLDQPITCELMTHPGYACKGEGSCGYGADDFSQSPDREYEKSILESQEMLEFYKANDITLVPYHKCVA